MVVQGTISSMIYPKLKIAVWAAYAYGIYHISAGGHWGAYWDYITTDKCSEGQFLITIAVWVISLLGTITSVVVAVSSIEDGKFRNQWHRLVDEVYEEKMSIFLGMVLGLLYVLLVPHLITAWIFYGMAKVLSKKCIPKR